MSESEDVCPVCGDLNLGAVAEELREQGDFENLDALYTDEGAVVKEKAAALLADRAGIEEAMGVCSGCARLWVEHPSIEDASSCSCMDVDIESSIAKLSPEAGKKALDRSQLLSELESLGDSGFPFAQGRCVSCGRRPLSSIWDKAEGVLHPSPTG